MKVVIVNGGKKPKDYLNKLASHIDTKYQNSVIKISESHSTNDKEIIDDIRWSYKHNDYDFYIYAVYSNMNKSYCIDRISTLCNVNIDDIFALNFKQPSESSN